MNLQINQLNLVTLQMNILWMVNFPKRNVIVLITDVNNASSIVQTFYIWGYDFKTDGDNARYDPKQKLSQQVWTQMIMTDLDNSKHLKLL